MIRLPIFTFESAISFHPYLCPKKQRRTYQNGLFSPIQFVQAVPFAIVLMDVDHVQHDSSTHPMDVEYGDYVDDTIDHDTVQTSKTFKPKKARSKPSTDRAPGQTILPIPRIEAIVHADGKSRCYFHVSQKS